ncbi:MAG TPA: WD40 repeat domain-containing protein [Spirochaetes bacterium]|nr:WD40 repeat domain-containing protein [Spirochaetota bacterium]
MSNTKPSPIKTAVLFLTIVLSVAAPAATNLHSSELYDLVYTTQPLDDGKLMFLRLRNPLRDPALRTFEIYVFTPDSGKISFLQKYNEMLYLPPAVSRDKSTIVYHSIIEGNDFLVTKNIQTGKSTRLRFDTGGYFVNLGLDYDNDTVAAIIKRGENKQAVYLISNRASTIHRIHSGTNFTEIDFLNDKNIYFVDTIDGIKKMAFTNERIRSSITIAEDIDYVQKAPNGDAVIYSKGEDLYLYRTNGRKSMVLMSNFDAGPNPPVFSADGSTCAVFRKDRINLANIPSGDILYFLSMNTEHTTSFLTDFTFFISKDSKVFLLKHKKPGQVLTELFAEDGPVRILSASPDDRYLVYQKENSREIIIYDLEENIKLEKELDFVIQKVIFSIKGESFYIVTLTGADGNQIPVRELYLYNFLEETMFAISTAKDTDVKLYLRKIN